MQVRNLATVGGNVCNAAPSADMVAAAAGAGRRGGHRRARRGSAGVPLASFFPGVRRTVLGPDELLVEIVVPAPGPRSGGHYLRHTPRRELDIAVVGVASQLTLSNGVCAKARIALAAVAPDPVRATAAEQALEGQPVTPGPDRAGGGAGRRARPADQRPARLRRLSPAPGPRPDPPHPDDRARAGDAPDPGGRSVAKHVLSCTVNGEAVEVLVQPYDTLLDALREELGLTGPKEGCGTGDCGACTVHLDGKPVASCLMLAMQARGRVGADHRGAGPARARSTRSRTRSSGTACPSAASASRAC